ncbi:hypothetical protein [Dactylosporangium darangshiense]|uniref:hypothetical protein n=1 Tax=Dactylosporangium darangshiense TaxID=579108 RepID=UPI00363C983E
MDGVALAWPGEVDVALAGEAPIFGEGSFLGGEAGPAGLHAGAGPVAAEFDAESEQAGFGVLDDHVGCRHGDLLKM